MNNRFRFDAEDPFGSRPDEKPPAGWDARFWDGVLERIEQRRVEPASRQLPEPPRRGSAAGLSVLVMVALAMATAAGTAIFLSSPLPHPVSGVQASGVPATVIRVSGAADPAVAVEWARSGGHQSGYVVLESMTPEISYVLIDRRLKDQGLR